jgi:hypothetical protein
VDGGLVSYTYIPRYLVLFLFFIFTSDYGLIDNTRSGPSKVALNADRYQLEGECPPPPICTTWWTSGSFRLCCD